LETLLEISRLPPTHPRHEHFQTNDLSPLWLEVSLAFWNDPTRQFLEPGAPSIQSRLDAVAQLQQAGVPVALRIDPLFPRDPLCDAGKTMSDFGLFDFQSHDDLQNLVSFAKQAGIKKIIYSPLKITKPRMGGFTEVIMRIKDVYEHVARTPLEYRGNSWRLPHADTQRVLFDPLLKLCTDAGIQAKNCKENLLMTP
jgi:DNA repair photolyase